MTHPLPEIFLQHRKPGDTISLDDYRRNGGYEDLRNTLGKRSPGEIKQMVADSGLRGLGGAGFPTGRKWIDLAENAPFPRYVISNADEMEPGTFKDHALIKTNPHVLIEGTIIAGYAASAEKGFIFIRPSYEESAAILEGALGEAREAGLLGPRILGGDFSFDIVVHRSAGRYICGEGKGLVHALEGKRAHPNIEGHLAEEGLWGKPTILNNAETLASIPAILKYGPEGFKGLARSKNGIGTKLYCVSGKVKRPGCYELPMGIPLNEIIEEHAGGMKEGLEYKTCLPGGASTRYVPKAYYTIEMDFDSFRKIGPGHRLGTGAIMVFDHKTCLVGTTLSLIEFFARESCGWCTPCREGLPYIRELLWQLENGEGKEEFIPKLYRMSEHLFNAYCAFAPGAATPVLGLLEDYRDEVREHISQRKCPYKV